MNRRFYKKVPAEEIRYQPKIYKFLRERVKGQDTSLNGVAAILSNLLLCREARVFKLVLGGAEGSGKNTTILAIKELLGMQEGHMYAGQFVEVHGALLNDGGHKTGGHESIKMMNKLKKARESVISSDTGKEIVHPYMCLFIDDVDKACGVFMDYLGHFLDHDANCEMAGGKNFVLPHMTPLLVLFTTNCASNDICRMTKTDDVMASHMIIRALEQRWPERSVIKHLQPVLPYYPLNNDTLEPILMEKFEEYVRKSALSNRFGPQCIHYADEVKSMLIKHVLARVDTSPGVQGSIGQLFYKLDIVFSMGLGVIQTMVAENEPLLKPIMVTAHSIDTHRFAESLDKQLENVIKELSHQEYRRHQLSTTQVIDSIFDNPDNHQIMDQCDTNQKGTVEAVTMAYGDRPLCSLVVNITYNNYQMVTHLEQHEEVQHLKRRLTSYKTTLKEMIHTIDRTCIEQQQHSAFHSTMKKIADNTRELIESSDTSDDDSESATIRKRIRSSSLSLGPLSKRPRVEEQTMLDLSDEIEFYTRGCSNSGDDELTMEEEPEELALCLKCEKIKPLDVFIRKRKNNIGQTILTQVDHCSTCRKCRK